MPLKLTSVSAFRTLVFAVTNICFKKCSLSFLLIISILSATTPGYASGSTTSFGTNVSPSLYYDCDFMFTDLLLHSTGWWGGPLTANGYPASGNAQDFLYIDGYPSGDYQFYGEGDFAINFQTPTRNLQKVGNVTTAIVTVTDEAPFLIGSQNSLMLINLTVNDPNNPPNNFHLIAPGYPAYPNNPTFSSSFLQALAPFTTMRMMDYMNTNQPWYGGSTSPVTWASRPNDNYFGYANAGQSYEKMIQLANTACKDLWINIPLYATDDWATGMAQLIKSTLNPNLHVYYEFCNENWNWGFGQWGIVENWDQTNTALTTDAAWARHAQEMAFLIMHFRNIMQPILGDQGRPIFAGQFGGGYSSDALAFIQQAYGPPNQYLWGFASAPYFGPANTDTDLDSLFADMNTSITTGSWNQQLQNDFALSKKYNLPYCCYESGQGLNYSDLATAAQQDPRMGACYQAMGNVLIQNNTALCNFYNFIGSWGQYGYWGALSDVREAASNPTVKYTAEVQLAQNGAPSCNCNPATSTTKQHNIELAPHQHNVMPPSATPAPMTKAQMQTWAAELAAKNAAKAAAATAKKHH